MLKAKLLHLLVISVLLVLPATGLGHSITNIVFTPPSPATVDFEDQVTLTFDYETDEATGVRIFPRPVTLGGLTTHYSASASPLYATGSGSGSGYFTITEGTVVVDQVRFQMWDANQDDLLLEIFVDVDYTFDEITPTEPSTWGQIKVLFR